MVREKQRFILVRHKPMIGTKLDMRNGLLPVKLQGRPFLLFAPGKNGFPVS
jgi:hypothetical protein